MYGIDISQHQGINFDMTKQQHDFVIIRAGFGLTEDPLFRSYADQAERLGIPYGVYWYSYACEPSGGAGEARKCLEVIKGRKISAGVWIDMEDADRFKRQRGALTPYVCSGVCKNFCDAVAAAGYHAGIYASASWFGPRGFITDVYGYDRWVARWYDGTDSKAAEMQGTCSIWQYRGAPLDLDLMFVPLSWFGGHDEPSPVKTVDQLADEVIRGAWGNGQQRKRALEQAGYSYDLVQRRVNEKLSAQPAEPVNDVTDLAWRVIAGEFGNEPMRSIRLRLAGCSDPAAVQREVNRLLLQK